MALSLLNTPNKWASLGSSLGKGVGEGLSSGLEVLVQHKMQEIAKSKRQAALLKAGLPAEYADLDPQTFQLLANHHLQEKANRAFAQAQGLLNGLDVQQGMSPEPSPQHQDIIKQLQQEGYRQQGNQIFGMQEQPNAQDAPQIIDQVLFGGSIGGPNALGKIENQLPFMGYGQQPSAQQMAPQQSPGLIPGTKQIPNELLAQMSPAQQQKVRAIQAAQRKEQIELANLALKQKKAAQSDEKFQHALEKESREYLAPIGEQNKEIDRNIRSNELLMRTANKGNLRAGNVQQFLSKIGLEHFNQPFDNEIASKEIARLAQNIKTAFGGRFSRLTNYLEQTFQKSLPSLWNTPQGILAISGMLIATDKFNKAVNKLHHEIIRENKGKVPWDIDNRVEELAQKRGLDDLYRQSIDDAINSAQLPLVGTLTPAEKKDGHVYGVRSIEDPNVVYKIKDGYWQRS